MPASLQLRVTHGPGKGTAFTFASHDTFLLGRNADCHAHLPDDTRVSRHHFLLEACPPQAILRDLGSLNGTHVNGQKHGGRQPGETPEQGARRRYPEIALKQGDRIQAGDTQLEVHIHQPAPKPGPPPLKPAANNLDDLTPKQLADLLLKNVHAGKKPLFELTGYTIDKELGRGGYGAVFRAQRHRDKQTVAIKVLLPRVAVQPAEIEKFLREMAVTATLRHPNLITLHDQGHCDGLPYFIMEYCEGGSIADLMQQHGGKLPLAIAKPIMLGALEGLAHAHSQGFVHRDLKPQNILLSQGHARISDFGLAKNFQQAGLSGFTLTGNYAGTPHFMPREQIINYKHVKPASDVWSLAATFYFMLTGHYPYPFDGKRDPIDVILNEAVVPIEKRDKAVPKALANAINQALATNIKDRLLNGEQFKRVFATF